MAKLAVIRLRSGINANEDVRDTMKIVGLTKINHCILVDDSDAVLGMLQKAKDYITWGEATPQTIEHLLRRWGRLSGNRRLTDEEVKSKGAFQSIKDFADAISSGKAGISSLPGLKKVFRLHPPRKGFKSTKRPFKDFGDLGYRGEKINDLIIRMA
ncbi:MAG: 50S ribosomal protein L30 [Candidatus Hadarchaeota archaeon]